MAIRNSYNAGDTLDFMLDDIEDEVSHAVFQFGCDSSQTSFDCFPESQLCIPEDPIEDLEWFPNFVDDSISISGFTTTPERKTISFSGFPTTPERETEDNSKRVVFAQDFERVGGRQVIPSKKPRSKRACGRVWSLNTPLPIGGGGGDRLLENQIPVEETSEDGSLGRKCSHCGSEKTPQWRMGPMGPKTLCNACGVRYKSGRLVSEYRPAASPSFDSQVHSNNHKKIMKMRRTRDE